VAIKSATLLTELGRSITEEVTDTLSLCSPSEVDLKEAIKSERRFFGVPCSLFRRDLHSSLRGRVVGRISDMRVLCEVIDAAVNGETPTSLVSSSDLIDVGDIGKVFIFFELFIIDVDVSRGEVDSHIAILDLTRLPLGVD